MAAAQLIAHNPGGIMGRVFSGGTTRRARWVLASTVSWAIVTGQMLGAHSGWVVQLGTSALDAANSVAVDGQDVYVAGLTAGTFPGEVSAGGQDVYIRAYTTDGRLRWTRQFGTVGPDGPTAGTLRAQHKRVVVAGFVRGALPNQTWAGAEDAFVAEYDRNGNLLWTMQFGTAGAERVRSIALAEDGSIYVLGNTTGQLTGWPNEGGTDAFVAQLSADGRICWLRQFGTAGTDEGIGIAVSHRAIYVSGTTNGAFAGQINSGDFDNFVMRMTLNGQTDWLTQFGTPAFDAMWKISIAGPTLFVGGNTLGAYPGEAGLGGYDAVVAALDRRGRVRWVHQFGTDGNDLSLGLAADRFGAVAVGTIAGLLPPGSIDPHSDGFAYRYDPRGNLQWALRGRH